MITELLTEYGDIDRLWFDAYPNNKCYPGVMGDDSVWCVVYGVWCMAYGVWYVWCVVYGVWCMVCMVYGVW